MRSIFDTGRMGSTVRPATDIPRHARSDQRFYGGRRGAASRGGGAAAGRGVAGSRFFATRVFRRRPVRLVAARPSAEPGRSPARRIRPPRQAIGATGKTAHAHEG
ncbi:hypothetical protein GCM10010211_76890 [Streptomyces albospinus]|uniref:Uncharacterized protein n=1 Tax=Streptomyces albospinus TaxID=285515 RepID=A0ABQ2VMD8_9ACTN|nr:hypothetical protein GCM10010211_76890 [Streptomyces albospinus]